MTISSITRRPVVGEVGVLAKFAATGSLVGTEGRWYLASAPISSKLPTLETLSAAERQKARLTVENDLAQFTPDVPGHYQVEHHDVTVAKTLQTYDEQVPTPDTDNDFAGAPVVNLGSGDGPGRYVGQTEYQVVQTLSRIIGQAPNTLTITLRVRDDVEALLPDAVTLVGVGPSGQFAQYDDAILGVRDLLREGRVRNNLPDATRPPVLQANLRDHLLYALNRWTMHIKEDATRNIHLVSDNVNAVSGTTVTDLAGALTRLAALRTAYTAHIASTTYHTAIDDRNTIKTGTANPTDLPTAIAFARLLWQTMVNGSAESTLVEGDTPGVAIYGHFILGRHVSATGIDDPEGATSFDFSSTLPGLLRAVNEMTRLYNAHRVRVSQGAAHAAEDTENAIQSFGQIPSAGAGNVPEIPVGTAIQLINQLAECIERHTADLERDGSPASWHQKTRPQKVGLRAGDLGSAIQVLELCCAAMETHALDGGGAYTAHPVKVWGGNGSSWWFYPGTVYCFWPLMTRAQLHWRRYVQASDPPVHGHLNALPIQLGVLGWK